MLRRREGGTADHDRDLGAELLDRDFGYAPTFGFGLRESFAGGSVDQYAMDALIVIQARDAAVRAAIK